MVNRSLKVGLVGESPNDTKALRALLSRVYPTVSFVTLVSHIRGSQLDTEPFLKRLRIEFEAEKPKVVIFARDLDALATDRAAVVKRNEFFKKCFDRCGINKRKSDNAIKLLSVYALEAFILADYSVFEQKHKCALPANIKAMDPDAVIKPEEELKKIADYKEYDASEYFSELDHSVLVTKLTFYRNFISSFERALRP